MAEASLENFSPPIFRQTLFGLVAGTAVSLKRSFYRKRPKSSQAQFWQKNKSGASHRVSLIVNADPLATRVFKRIYAHESEPGATAEPCIYVFKFDRKTSKWQRTVVYRGEPAPAAPINPELRDALQDFRPGSAGTGLQMALHDLDADGDVDIVAPGKSGLYWFENPRR